MSTLSAFIFLTGRLHDETILARDYTTAQKPRG